MDTMPESRTERVTASVTKTEKRLIELASTVAGRTVSELLLDNSIEELVARGRVISERLRELSAAA